MRAVKIILVIVLVLALIWLMLAPASQKAAGQEPTPTPTLELRAFIPLVMGDYSPPSRWKGIGVTTTTGHPDSLTNMPDVTWFMNWAPHGPWNDSRYVPMVRPGHSDTQAKLDQLGTYAANNPGRMWLVFNEPDISDQDNITPAEGAALYQDIYDAIKGADPTAKLFVGGTAFSTTAWLDAWYNVVDWGNYSVDGIHFHGYPCPRDIAQECIGGPNYYAFNSRWDMELMTSRLDGFYNYCQSKPEFAGKPIWLTEIGILSTTSYDTRESVKTGVMDPLLAYLDGGGLDKFGRVGWFSDRYAAFSASDLTFADNTLTVLGERWNQWKRSAP